MTRESTSSSSEHNVVFRSGLPSFYREVLDPSDLEPVITKLLKTAEHRTASAVMEYTSDLVKTPFAHRIENLREFTASALAAAMNDVLAELIVDEYLLYQEDHVVSAKTAANYTRKSENLLERYRAELGHEQLDDLSPVTVVMCLFAQSKRLTSAAWQQYRSSLLFAFRKTRGFQMRCSREHKAYDHAIALLAVVNEPPHVDERAPETSADRRKGVPNADYEAVLERLKSSPVNRSLTAMDFAIVTRATGLRPGEWANACLVEPDVGKEDEPAVLRVRSAKTKHNDEPVYRSLILTSPEVEAVVRRHLRNVWSEIQAAGRAWRVAPLDNLIKKCSARIDDECKWLWPTNTQRRFTLYSLRHQAAADFKRAYGKENAAGMMGHSEKVSRRHYARMDRSTKGLTVGVAPGPDVTERIEAAREANKQRSTTAKPWDSNSNVAAKPMDPDADVNKPEDDSAKDDQPS